MDSSTDQFSSYAPSSSSSDQTSGFGSFSGFGSGTGVDINSPDGLLALAQQQGGNIAEAADAMVHPQTSILSTIGNGFKNAFKDFVDVLSVPSEAVAGMLSSQYSVSQAVAQHIRPSDVIFGAQDPNASTMQKVGGFLVRTATDILTDPLTYITFGAGEGIFGLRATSELTLGEQAAAQVGKEVGDVANLSSKGQDIYRTLTKASDQADGSAMAKVLSTGDANTQLAGEELQKVLDATIDQPLNIDFANKAMSNLLERFPQLSETLLDKGGIKVFGQSILSGQRIASAITMVPGMTMLDKFTAPTRSAISALFDPAMVKTPQGYVRLPGEYMDLEQASKDMSSSLMDDRVQNFSNVVKANKLNETQAQLLRASIEGGKMPADPQLANAFKQLTGFNENELQFLKARGFAISRLDNHVPRTLVKTKTTNIPFKLPPNTKLGAAIQRKVEGPMFSATPEQLTEAEQHLANGDVAAAQKILDDTKREGFEIFDPNAVTSMARRSLDNVRVGTAKDFMRSVAATFGLPASEAPEGWIPISSRGMREAGKDTERIIGVGEDGAPVTMSADQIFSSSVSKDGEQLYYHPAVAQRVEDHVGSVINDDATKDFLKAYDSIQNLWKASVTSIFPAFHGRNAISNVLQNFSDLGYHALNPVTYVKAAHLWNLNRQFENLSEKAMGIGEDAEQAKNALHDLTTQKVFSDTTGNSWSFGEMRSVLRNHNIAFTSSSGIDSADVGLSAEDATKQLFPQESLAKKVVAAVNPLSQNNVAFKGGRVVGNVIENQARMVNFLANLHNTGDVTLAAKRTKQFLFDYGNLTNFEKTFMKRIMPFYSYTRKNIELQAHTLMTTPGRTLAQIQGLQNLSDVMSGGQLSAQEEAALPDWIKSGIEIVRKRDGQNVEIISSLGTPVEQPFQALQPNQLLGSLSPLLRVPLEQATGYSLYQGKMLSDVTNASAFKNAPQAIKNLIGYTSFTAHRSDGTAFDMQVSLNPSMMNLILNLPPTSRVLSALKQMDAVDVANQDKLMQQLIGSKPYSFDLVQEQQKRINEQKQQLQDMLTKAGVLAKFTKVYKPNANSSSGFKGF